MSGTPAFPERDEDFDAFYHRVVEYVLAKVMVPNPEWTHIPVSAAEALAADYGAWHAAWEATRVPHLPPVTLAKNNAREHSQKVIADFRDTYLSRPPVTNEDLLAMGFHIHDTTPTTVNALDEFPVVEARTAKARIVDFWFKGRNNKRWGKPKHAHGMELKWIMADTPPASVDDFPHSEFATRNPLRLVFDEADRGKRLYYIARWETEAAKKSEFSEIYWVIIP
jgi:hypothetical protein